MRLTMLFYFILTLCGLYAVVMVVMYFSQTSLLYHPAKQSVMPQDIGEDANIRQVWSSHDGLEIPVWVMPAKEDNKPFYLLHFHGNTGEVSSRLMELRPILSHGIGGIFTSYRYNADPAGAPSEAALKKDAETFYEQAKKRLGLKDDQIILYGESLGSGMALHLAAQGKGRAVVMEGGYASILELATQEYWWLPVRFLLRDWYDSRRYMPAISIPILQLHGGKDRVIPLESARKIADLRPDIVTLKIFAAAGHNDLLSQGGEKALRDFIDGLNAL